ncbi:uncharacterized protein LOC111892546 isoform X1 [Lactuca sativa]|uniref:DNA-directed RNA polymerase III subunit RPC4 n=1 Tax=Lactuca sativa TaxID=4236 RepID=A0A9R1XD76_LACSA|nr:uncharacterized protein LOC111892546 isoform X1 [Lactuca sativa]XP_052620015.1 uncharacterized protein LOC111892546 isoform X1 [Lactuca sativa]KAJ0206029.1 hypothetical protein LSAT_V11C500279710 [Lactuca sativa]
MQMDENTGNGAPKPPRKMKFKPKAPPKREQKLLLPKPEKFEDDEADDEKAKELMKMFKETSNRPKFKTETKPSARVSSFNFGTKSGGGNAATSSIGAKEYKEPWDYYKYYPVTLPLRIPYSGNPELLDEQEFNEESETNAYNESSVNPAEELGLLEEDLEKKLIFFQLPATMPIPNQSVKTEGKPLKNASKASSLNEVPAGSMGKMLVYKSGVVKLKLGDHLFNVSGGLDCSFAQDLVVMNSEEKYCCNVGELNKRVVITPDIESVLDNMDIS